MDLEAESELLRKADRDIEAGRARIERQKAIVRRFVCAGHDIESAVALLKSLEGALEAMQAHRVLIEEHVAHLQRERTKSC
ncbi:hypothetical protein AWB75_05715 [Caballeronia catudaia]|uniref:Uncharacterized protein n=1 Tax=Caballeronia catudaia TaxID=1777136 RepID=A0A158CTU4_9BURK|nr:hypothetical protein [Caballeronia catudaia]SAK85630.1 hypothetical protein AWB75_05715 [Caballeronia catudaia]